MAVTSGDMRPTDNAGGSGRHVAADSSLHSRTAYTGPVFLSDRTMAVSV